jgi:hypothetical protein
MILLSIATKTDSEITDAANAAAICGRLSELIPVSTSVSASRNAIIEAERASAPLMSIEGDPRFFS